MARTPSRGRNVTLADVGRHAGVSSAVVSYVVNNGPRPVAPETADRVREAIAFLGYRPNTTARALSTGSTGILGVVHPGTANPFFGEYNDVIYETATRAGIALLTATSAGSAKTERGLIEALAGRNVDGIISMTSMNRHDVARLRDPGIPLLFVNCPFAVPGFHTIGPDAVDGSRRVVGHLLDDHHHAQVALIAGDTGASEPEERESGWRDAHRMRGLEPGPVVRTTFTADGGYEAAQRLLDQPSPASAVFVTSDLQALGVLHAIHSRSLRVPEDIAVVSFDGISEAAHTWPPLTVVRQPLRAMAQVALDNVLSGTEPAHTLVPTELVIRRSCGCSSPGDELLEP
ncbi:LacI family transcriptional regulator [Humibacillus xanthopallidus]|uniref:LacI family transcriptional regulator n=1 Tax=Humibacillus xanthopallidus TaxID=412689 RepID=A0A543PLW5_9MICO|nr:LacI family DNA-binding transcriptional regulator [Humibacillus xanthopallidus]TQN45071.1 LacI family transcriptional regulator [Humibacillus xanthopallidus]